MNKFECYCCKKSFEGDIDCLITLITKVKNGETIQYIDVPVCKKCNHLKEENDEN